MARGKRPLKPHPTGKFQTLPTCSDDAEVVHEDSQEDDGEYDRQRRESEQRCLDGLAQLLRQSAAEGRRKALLAGRQSKKWGATWRNHPVCTGTSPLDIRLQ